jgi:hypothetical protein
VAEVSAPSPAPNDVSLELPLSLVAPPRRGRPRRVPPPEAVTDALPEPAEG